MNIGFYSYTGRRNTVRKTLGDPTTLEGVLRDSCSLLAPVVTVRGDIASFNYCYIETLGRYYFIDSVTINSADKYTLRLGVDVLMTYADEILEATGTVTRMDAADKYISSRQRVKSVVPNLEQIDFDQDLFTTDGSIIMITLKGNA